MGAYIIYCSDKYKQFLIMKLKQRTYIYIVLILVIVIAFVAVINMSKSDFPSIPKDSWQAVFLDNNQVYFGKLSDINKQYVSLTNVYYLRTADSLTGDKAVQGINLVKLGGELHGPEDLIYIPKTKIMFWENLTAKSSVVKTISASKK